jgi:glutamyl-tRNA synthetase
MTQVRVRFAPSPTGALHIGGVRTALYNYLFAKKSGGKMLLRIEDTDQTRFVPGAEAYIMEALNWVGIKIDEGHGVGGPEESYRQSERMPIYKKYADQLLADGMAYYAFDTAEELEAMRKRLEEAKVYNPSYNAVTRMQMTNSLTLSADEVKRRLDAGEAYVIRLKVPVKEEIRFKDIVRDWVTVHSSVIDDKVLLKSDGMPTYHLANVVDDHLMGITHVIRGEEWLPSAPLHVLLYRSLGLEKTMPQFAHLPLLLKPEGNGKLSKRDALAGGFPIFPLDWQDPSSGENTTGFRESGYLPEALVNFLAFLGWNPGTDQEIFSMDELVEAFDLEKIHKAGARFDINKAKWFNQQYLKAIPDETLSQTLANQTNISIERASKLVKLMKDRVTFLQEVISETVFLNEIPAQYDADATASKWNDDAKRAMPVIKTALAAIEGDFVSEKIHDAVFKGLEEAGFKPGKVMAAMRLAITGLAKGPDLMLSMEIIGQAGCLERIDKAVATLG